MSRPKNRSKAIGLSRDVRESIAGIGELGVHYVDLPTTPGQQAPLRFTFLWTDSGKWEGRDDAVAFSPAG